MDKVTEVVRTLGGMPADRLILVLAFACIGLAAFAIYAMLSVAKGRKEQP